MKKPEGYTQIKNPMSHLVCSLIGIECYFLNLKTGRINKGIIKGIFKNRAVIIDRKHIIHRVEWENIYYSLKG